MAKTKTPAKKAPAKKPAKKAAPKAAPKKTTSQGRVSYPQSRPGRPRTMPDAVGASS